MRRQIVHSAAPLRLRAAYKRAPRAQLAESAVFCEEAASGKRTAMEAPIQSSPVDGQPFCGSYGSTSAVDAEGYATELPLWF